MDRRFPLARHYLSSRPPHDSIPIKTFQLRVTTNPTTKRTSSCRSSRLPHQKTDPHSSRVEHHSPTLSTSRASFFRRSSATLPRAAHLGSRDQFKTRSPPRTSRKNLLAHSPRTR